MKSAIAAFLVLMKIWLPNDNIQLADGTYTIYAKNTNFVLDNFKMGITESCSHNVLTNPLTHTSHNNQKFLVASVETGYYSIVNVENGKAMTSNGGEMSLQPITGGNDQQFTLTPRDDGLFNIQSRETGRFVEAPTGAGENLFESCENHQTSQLFSFLPSNKVGPTITPTPIRTQDLPAPVRVTNGTTYYIQSYKTGQNLAIKDNSMVDGGNLVHASAAPSPGQQFTANRLDNGLYTITSTLNGKALTVPNSSQGEVPIVQQTLTNADNQQWKFIPEGNGFYVIESRVSNKVLQASKGNSLITQKQRTFHGSQQFRLSLTP